MSIELAYLDTSAFVKVPLGEPQAQPLIASLADHGLVSSWLLAVEAVRACARYGEAYAREAERGLRAVSLIPLDESILRIAQGLRPATLRTLDALHLATALSVSPVSVIATYDERLAGAATSAGLNVIAPE